VRSLSASLAFLIFLFYPCFGWTASWDKFREASRQITSFEAQFVQKKTLPILARPFLSHGRFFFQTPASLRWEYDDPVRSVLLVHGGAVKRYLKDQGSWREDAGAALPALQMIFEEIMNWQMGRFETSLLFQASQPEGPDQRILLVPKDPSWSKMVRQVELMPSREQAGVIKNVRVVEDDRSFTLLEFSRVQLNRSLPASLFVNVE
jgi:outer membrane lipoprotein-sorting protein